MTHHRLFLWHFLSFFLCSAFAASPQKLFDAVFILTVVGCVPSTLSCHHQSCCSLPVAFRTNVCKQSLMSHLNSTPQSVFVVIAFTHLQSFLWSTCHLLGL